MHAADQPAPAPRTAMDDYDLASLALCAFEGVTQPRITRTKWRDGIDLEIATPGLRRFADAVVESELSNARAEAERLKDRAKQAELDRDMWKAEVRRTTDEYVKTTREALAEAERLREALEQAHDAMEAFTDPEGNMPERTGEFNDLKKALHATSAALAAARKEDSGG